MLTIFLKKQRSCLSQYQCKAQRSFVFSIILFSVKTFLLLFIPTFILILFSLVGDIWLKAKSYGIDFSVYIPLVLDIVPLLASIAIPYIFIISLFIIIRKFRKYYKFYSLYLVKLRFVFLAGFIFSILLSILIYFSQTFLLKKFDTIIEKNLLNTKQIPIALTIEPLTFNYINDYVFFPYLFSIKDNRDEKIYGNIYKKKSNKIVLIGRGSFVNNQRGDIYFEIFKGIKFDYNKNIKDIDFAARIYLMRRYRYRSTLNWFIKYYKKLISRPAFPIPLNKKIFYNSAFYKSLKKIQTLQLILLSLSPIIIYLFFSFILYSNKIYSQNIRDNVYLWILILWAFALLTFPMFTKISYHTPPSLFWYNVILGITISIMLLGLVERTASLVSRCRLIQVLIKFLLSIKKAQRVIIVDKGLNFKYLNIKNINISNLVGWIFNYNFYIKSKIKLSLLFLKKYINWIIFGGASLIFFQFFFRIFIHWKMNNSMDNLQLFLIIQLLDLPEEMLSILPYLIIIIIPLMIYDISKNRILNRVILSGKNPLFLLKLISFYAIITLIFSFFFREFISYEWKKRGYYLYQNRLLNNKINNKSFDNNKNKRFYNKFLKLPSDKIVIYGSGLINKNSILLKDIVVDTIKDHRDIIIAKEAHIKNNKFTLLRGYKINFSGSEKNTKKYRIENFTKIELKHGKFIKDFLQTRQSTSTATSWQIYNQIKYDIKSGNLIKNYKINILLQRILPYFFTIIILSCYPFIFLRFILKPEIPTRNIFSVIFFTFFSILAVIEVISIIISLS